MRADEWAFRLNPGAVAYLVKKDFDRAIADATKAIELDPKWYRAYLVRPGAYEAKGEKALADKDREKVKELEGQPK